MSRVVCRRGVSRGAMSRSFTAEQLLDALEGNDGDHVYMELDSGGWLSDASGRGAERLAARARLAPHVHAADALLALCAAPDTLPAGSPHTLPASPPHRLPASPPHTLPASPPHTLPAGPPLRVLVAADLPPHAELLLWFAQDALAALDMPFLTLRNIRGRGYVCHACGATFLDPNPLKLHLFLSCAPFEPRAFWSRAAQRLRAAAGAPRSPPARGTPRPSPATVSPRPPPSPAELEALATEWGRSRAGHVCVYCGKLYSRRYGLKIHIRTHTGYRPLRCRYCLRAFGDPSNLNKHVRLHAAARPAPLQHAAARQPAPLQCAQCGRALARRRDLERHERTHHAARQTNETQP